MVNAEISFVEQQMIEYLSWTQRLEIAIDSAKGLLFLHTYHDRSIIHREIKVENGYEFTSKV